MFNHPNPFPQSGSYSNLAKRMTQSVQKEVGNQMIEMIQHAFEKALNKENIVLLRPDKARMLRQITKTMLTDMLTKLDSPE